MKINSDVVLDAFHQKKILMLDDITSLLQCSKITARRKLKVWKTYTSYNCNGRYYTLVDIPKFDKNGIWKHKNACFSKWGTLKKTLQHLIEHSEAGLNIIEVNKILGVQAQNFLSQQFLRKNHFYREKHKGIYIYYSKDQATAETQKETRNKSFAVKSTSELPTDAQAVVILVELIKHPNDSVDQLFSRAKYRGIYVPYNKIRHLLEYHDLLKKTSE